MKVLRKIISLQFPMLIRRDKKPENAGAALEQAAASTNIKHIPQFTNEEITTYEQKTIKVLEILEKQGTNIYSLSNYGGMYLKTKKGQAEKLSKFFDDAPSINKEEEEKQSNISDLIDFFK